MLYFCIVINQQLVTSQSTLFINNFNFLRIMRTMKIKLPFATETGNEERSSKLIMWANAFLRNARLNILEIMHYGTGSYIVVENTRNELLNNGSTK